MLRVQKSANGQVVFKLSGRIDADNVVELETLLRSERNGRGIVLDLKDVTLVNRDAVSFLERCEAESITLRNCPAYVREWITRQRSGS
jgi:anti-anti-sigma regulatory factor